MTLGLLFGAGELLVRTLPGRVTLGLPRTVFTSLADWGHLLGAAVWLGGLAGLVVTASFLHPPVTGGPNTRLRVVARRFSYTALVCVGVLTLSGLWTAWIHVGALPPLFTTLYGQTLLVKLALFLALVALGAFNLLWLLPRMDAARVAAAPAQSGFADLLRPFRRTVMVEVVIGLTVLLIVPFLSGSARTQAAQLRAADLNQTAMAGNLPVTFTPSALQPGAVRYDVFVPARDLAGVALAFASPTLGVPETMVTAITDGEGHYHVTGLYAPMIGVWQVRVLLHGPGTTERSAPFALTVRATPVIAPPVTTVVQPSTWAWGVLETLLVLLALIGAAMVSRRLASPITSRDKRLSV